MEPLKKIVGENLAELRKEKKLTQLELAEKFNYSDKAVSKWETGETLPELDVLYQLCEFYGVTLDYLTHEDNKKQFVKDKRSDANYVAITCLFASCVWIVATIVFVYLLIINKITYWPIFVWGVPVTAIVVLIANGIYWKNRLTKILCWSIFVWGLLTSVVLTVFYSMNELMWPIFLVGVPMQISLVLWYLSKKPF